VHGILQAVDIWPLGGGSFFSTVHNHGSEDYIHSTVRIRYTSLLGQTCNAFLFTHHLPYSNPFEREWLNRLLQMGDFSGLVLLDDINLNAEMKKWWKELQDKAMERGYKTYDLTSVGHFSGTGLLDFSGKVKIVE
jgi:hypothetical protein